MSYNEFTVIEVNKHDFDSLIQVLPKDIGYWVECLPDALYLLSEIVIDVGEPVEARFIDGSVEVFEDRLASTEDTDQIIRHNEVTSFSQENRAGVDATLHRVSRILDRDGYVVGLTMRVGRFLHGFCEVIEPELLSGGSVLLLGKPGSGKTTMLRDGCRLLAESGKRVMVVDTSNEIAGEGAKHVSVGKARRMMVPNSIGQDKVMIEAVENHNPQVIIIDEISNLAEAEAAVSIAQRGVQLVATAHGNTLQDLIENTPLAPLVGDIKSATIGDSSARKQAGNKERRSRTKSSPFKILVELRDHDEVAIYRDLNEAIDNIVTRNRTHSPEIRRCMDDGRWLVIQTEKVGYERSGEDRDSGSVTVGDYIKNRRPRRS